MCPNEIFEWTCFWIVWVFAQFSDCGKNIVQHWRKNFREVVKSAFYLNNKTFRGKFVFWKEIFTFTIFSSFDVKLCGLLSESLLTLLKKLLSTLVQKHYHFSREKLPLLPDFERKLLEFCKFFIDMVVKTVFFLSRGHFWRNTFLFYKIFKNFSCFQTLRKTFLIFGEKYSGWVVKTVFKCPGGFLEEFIFENMFLELFLCFWSSGAIFLDLRRKFCDRFVKTAFYVYSGDFWLDCVFYKNLRVFSPSPGCEENILAFWRKNFKTFVKTALFRYKKF